eukprot:UN34836
MHFHFFSLSTIFLSLSSSPVTCFKRSEKSIFGSLTSNIKLVLNSGFLSQQTLFNQLPDFKSGFSYASTETPFLANFLNPWTLNAFFFYSMDFFLFLMFRLLCHPNVLTHLSLPHLLPCQA